MTRILVLAAAALAALGAQVLLAIAVGTFLRKLGQEDKQHDVHSKHLPVFGVWD